MVKAVFFDIDGTLLKFNEEVIDEAILTGLYALKSNGIKVLAASGRSIEQIKRVTDFPFDGFITSNGAVAIGSMGNTLYRGAIPYIDLFNLVNYLESNSPGFSISYTTEAGVYASRINDALEAHYQMTCIPIPENRPIRDLLRYKVYQLTAYIDAHEESKLIELIMPNCVATRWHDDFADINNQHYNKATGVAYWLGYFGIDKDEAMAFGDGGNDMEMLKYVKYGVAMGNARQEVKDIAYYVTDQVYNKGVLKALHFFNLVDCKILD